MKQPLVTVVIPAYNVAPYVSQAIDSVLAQTYKNIEIIVVDDGSKDATRDVVALYAEKNLVHYIYQENKGLSAARNTGIRKAKGEFIAILDSDDLFLPEKIQQQVAYLVAHPECGVSYCDVWHFRETEPDKMLTLKSDFYSGSEVFPHLLRKNFIIPLSVVFRKSEIMQVGLFDETRRRTEDWEYWLRLSYSGVQFCHLPEILAKCRLHRGSRQQGADGWEYKARERRSVLSVFKDLNKMMTPEERRHYNMWLILLEDEFKLWYVLIANYFPPFRWLLQTVQANRWDSAE
jgi:glycosyltransferase involved in cell wall biosynthesis